MGRVAMTKAQAEPGMAPLRDATGQLVRDNDGALVYAAAATRWVGTGRAVFDNKGQPVKQYEPWSAVPACEGHGPRARGGIGDDQRDQNDLPLWNLPHPNDAQALRNYVEQYEYDLVGNIERMVHTAVNSAVGSWTRRYAYGNDPFPGTPPQTPLIAENNRLHSTSLPGDSATGPYTATYISREMSEAGGSKWRDRDAFGSAVRKVDYNPAGQVHGQTTESYCTPANCQNILSDAGIVAGQDDLAFAFKTNDNGTLLADAQKGLNSLGINAEFRENLSLADLTSILQRGRSTVVGARIPGVGPHTLTVDLVRDGTVYIRDPLPGFGGSSYGIGIGDFTQVWKGTALYLSF